MANKKSTIITKNELLRFREIVKQKCYSYEDI